MGTQLYQAKLTSEEKKLLESAENLWSLIVGLQTPMRHWCGGSTKRGRAAYLAYLIFEELAFFNEDPHKHFLNNAKSHLPKLVEALKELD